MVRRNNLNIAREKFGFGGNIKWRNFGTKVIKPIVVIGLSRSSYTVFKFLGYGPEVIYGIGWNWILNSFKSKLFPIDDLVKNRLSSYKIDLIGVEISASNASVPINIWSCYIPNNINVSSHLWQFLFNLVTRNSLLCGNFNAFHPAWGFNSYSRRGNLIFNIIDTLGLGILNNGSPTHIGRQFNRFSFRSLYLFHRSYSESILVYIKRPTRQWLHPDYYKE